MHGKNSCHFRTIEDLSMISEQTWWTKDLKQRLNVKSILGCLWRGLRFPPKTGGFHPIAKRLGMAAFFIFLSCEMKVPEEEYKNPLDLTTNEELGIDPPALVFVPNQISTSTGSSVTLEVFVLEVDSVAGSQLQIQYDKSKLTLSSVTSGDFFAGSTEPLFFYENDPVTGTIDIYTLFMGDTKAVSGTGTLAYLVFSSTAPGQSTITYGDESELVDADDNPIQLNGLGQGVVDAQ